MHVSYKDAKCTVVHDLFLLNQNWTNSETACLAPVLSPWLTCDWTVLKLAMSRNVKVLFKSLDPTVLDICDLEDHILADSSGSSSRAHWLASSLIRRLWGSINNVTDIIAILHLRSTSWTRDRIKIASLLANISNPNFKITESEITQSLIHHLGFVPHSSLLHSYPTMTDSGGFSWCQNTLVDIPIAIRPEFHCNCVGNMLTVKSDGPVTGTWYAWPVGSADITE